MVKKRITESVTSNDPMSKRWRSTFAAARMAYETGELRQAHSLLARALEGARDLPDHKYAVPTTELGMAAVLLADKKVKEAEPRLQKIINSLEGETDTDLKELLAVALRFHAQALAELGREREAEKELKQSIDLLKDLGSYYSVQLAYSLSDLCGLYVAQGRLSEAGQKITRAMQILSTVFGTDCPEYVRADMIYTTCMPMQDESRLDFAKEGIGRMEYMYGAQHPNIARALDRYCAMLKEKGDTERLKDVQQRFSLKAAATK